MQMGILASVDLEAWSLTSITGIILITMGLVEILKRLFSRNEGFGKIPVFVYAMVIAAILATLANKVFKTEDGTPFLVGAYWVVLWRAVLSAAAASGFYSWLNKPETVADATPLRIRGDNK